MRDLIGGMTVFCKCGDCIHRTKDVMSDGFGLCSNTEAGMIVIIPGVNGPMCESYESEDDAKEREARDE